MTLEAAGPNAEQIEYWNRVAGPRWASLAERLDAQLDPIDVRAQEAAAHQSGERVIDVGCGCGASTLRIGRAVGGSGAVLGIDLSGPMLARARERAAAAGLAHVRFEHADAQTHAFAPETFDAVYSRFGVMFFESPETAFANLRAALRPGGRLAFACWQKLERNPWLAVPIAAALEHLVLEPPAPGGPGPFAFADPERASGILTRAGFVDVDFRPLGERITLGGEGGLDAAVDLLSQIGALSRALAEAAPETRERTLASVRDALAPHLTPKGVELGAAAWIVTARRGDGR